MNGNGLTEAGPGMRIVRGEPDELELAALVASLAAASNETDDDDGDSRARRDRWADPARVVRGGVAPRPGADEWRWSLR